MCSEKGKKRWPLLQVLVAQMVKKKKNNRLQCGRPRFNPWIGKIPWRREWLPTPVFFPGEFHGDRSLKAEFTKSQTRGRDGVTNIFTLQAQPFDRAHLCQKLCE